MRLALLRQGLFLWPRRRLRPRQTILGVPDFERHGVAAVRPNLHLVGERRSRTRRLIMVSRGADSGPSGAGALRHRQDRFAGFCHRRGTAIGFASSPSANVGVAFEKPVEPAAVISRLQSTSWDLGQAA